MSEPPRRSLHVVAIALVRSNPPRLFAARRRSDKRHGGLWELPGGQVESGESEEDALCREIQEELTLEVELVARLGEATVSAGPLDIRMAVHVCRRWTGEIRLVDHDASMWLTAATLESVPWAPADIPHLPALRALLAGTPDNER
jgi:8-oxo-dGTP diphosphatase